MTTTERTAELAAGWIEAWIRMDMEWLRERLASDFVHVSPFGRLEGRESYLATVEPMARKSVMELKIKDVIASGDQAAVWFENRTPKGAVPSCDWVRVEKDQIKEIRSFYDSARIREILSPSEQESLDGSYCGSTLTALFYESWRLAAAAGEFFLSVHLFVVLYEEPTLRRTVGQPP